MKIAVKYQVILCLVLGLAVTPTPVLLLEYGQQCTYNEEYEVCISGDPANPLTCVTTTTAPPTTRPPTTTPPPTTTVPTSNTPTTTTPITAAPTTPTTTTPTTPATATTTDPSTATSLEFDLINYQTLAEGICGCPEGMIWHEDLKQCVGQENGVCDFSVSDGSPMRSCGKFAECYQTSAESSQGKCYCDLDATYDPVTYHCRLTHGSPRCEKHEDCDNYNLLTCESNTCVCQYSHIHRWNAEEGKCGSIVGQSCNVSHPPFPIAGCVENAACIDNACICEEGFKTTPEDECKLKYTSACNQDSECHPSFRCLNNSCICPEDQIYFESTDTCHLLEGAVCDPSQTPCPLNSNCESGTCKCRTGYEASSEDHICEGLYGSKCSVEVPCHSESFLGDCNDTTTGFCECKQNYGYHAGAKRCVGNIDEVCNVDEDCVDHAICHEGRCVCGGTYIPGDGKTACYTSYGKDCTGIDCYPGHFLTCGGDATCTCGNPADQSFDASKGYCVAFVGRFCGNSGNGIECVGNAICAVDELQQTKCTCPIGYVANGGGLCDPDTGKRDSGGMKIGVANGITVFSAVLLTLSFIIS